ncbi:helix-turn-helix domain-containing protein [Streptomyces sp. NBC_01217]|uniref:helix-turn-helix domain-containing protein n=1 Tax=Streptomyces sp. NBC_01217 TaxID=2903779 RepID=UPI002E0EFB05|nr:helix-turn-helix domain-containing protein [Streptomyces sp. NBC_01217]
MAPNSWTQEPEQLSGTFYTTDSAPTHQKETYWREALSQTFAAVDIVVPDGNCSGTIRTSWLGHLQVTTVDGGPMRAQRTPRLIARGDDEQLVVKLLARGVATVEQDGHEADLQPGEIVLCDMARPIRMEFPHPFQTKSLILPRRLLGLRETDLRRITAIPLRPGTTMGSLLPPFVTRLVDTAATCASHTGGMLAGTVIDLLTMLAEERLRQEAGDAPSVTRLLEIQTFIDRHLADPDLAPEAIAHANQISVRYLHKLFQTDDITVSQWIQRRRLEECRRELARREAASQTIAAVARKWGFTSASHFSRTFRAAYGMSPAQWRDPAVRAPRVPSLPNDASRVPEASGAQRCRRSGLPPVRRHVHLAGQGASE